MPKQSVTPLATAVLGSEQQIAKLCYDLGLNDADYVSTCLNVMRRACIRLLEISPEGHARETNRGILEKALLNVIQDLQDSKQAVH